MICFTKVRLPYGWLGNMSPHGITDDGVFYPTAEHHFQLARLPAEHPIRERVLKTASPMGAKMAVKSVANDFIVTPLSERDLDNMRRTLKLKFTQHRALREQLIASIPQIIVEDVTSRQGKGSAMFWGGVPAVDRASYAGRNQLGLLLMELRGALV